MANPYKGDGVDDSAAVAGGYQILSTITQNSSSSESNYDYPADPCLLYTGSSKQLQEPRTAALISANAPALEMEAKKVPSASGHSDNAWSLEPANSAISESFSSSEGDSTDPGTVTIVRQVPSPRLRPNAEMAGDEKLYITGNLVENCPSVFFKTGSGSLSNGGFADEGIYQGLIMTDKQKKNIGILPESIYMTTNLMEKGALIESMSLLDSAPAVAVEIPEVPLPPSSPPIFTGETLIATNTIPQAPPPKPPRREKGTRTKIRTQVTSVLVLIHHALNCSPWLPYD